MNTTALLAIANAWIITGFITNSSLANWIGFIWIVVAAIDILFKYKMAAKDKEDLKEILNTVEDQLNDN